MSFRSRRHRLFVFLLGWLSLHVFAQTDVGAETLNDRQPDLQVPAVTTGEPSPGRRVKNVLETYRGSEVHHLVYLPTDWSDSRRFPVIVEYAGNQYRSSRGTVEGSSLGYGISGGKGVIWLCLPFVDREKGCNALTWWGDVEATVDYCQAAVDEVCHRYRGDPNRVFIAGFSRGAIACHYIGLHDDDIASLWRGFICHSHYDGVRQWAYEGSDREAAGVRLERLGSRPQFISHERSVEETRAYLRTASPNGSFTFLALPFSEHTDTWVLRESLARDTLRTWFWDVCRADQ